MTHATSPAGMAGTRSGGNDVMDVVSHTRKLGARRLPDGTELLLRPLDEGDADGLRRLFHRLSPSTVYLRFFQPVSTVSDARIRYLAEVDHDRREAIAAVHDGEIIGVARYDRLRDDERRAEMAVVVEDAWQGRGVGRLLLDALAADAHHHGVAAFTATVLSENRRMLRLTKEVAPHAALQRVGAEVDVEIPLGPPAARVAAR